MQPTLPELHPHTKALLAVIEAQARSGERALSNEAYAEMLSITIASQKCALRNLIKAKLIEVESLGSRSARRFLAPRLGQWTQASVKDFRVKTQGVTVKRPCLSCRTTFASEGPHNRLCSACRQDTALPSYSLAVFRGAPHAP